MWPGRAKDGLLDVVSGLFKNPEYSDLTIKCGAREWKAHKNIVCLQVPFFAKACNGVFKEAEENTIILKEDDPNAVHLMLLYMYTGDCDYEDAIDDLDLGLEYFATSIAVHGLADKYDMRGLVKMASARLKVYLEDLWSDPDFLADAVYEIYDIDADRARELRNIVVTIAAENAAILFADPRHDGFREAAANMPGFMMELASEMATERLRLKERTFRALSDDALHLYWTLKGMGISTSRAGAPGRFMDAACGLSTECATAAVDEVIQAKLNRKTGAGEDWV